MAEGKGKVVVNLATGHEDAERVTVAFLVAVAALEQGRPVTMFTTKEAVRLGLPGYAQAIEAAGSPPVAKLFDQFVEGGGELLLCPVCFNARALDEQAIVSGARIGGGPPLCGSGSARKTPPSSAIEQSNLAHRTHPYVRCGPRRNH